MNRSALALLGVLACTLTGSLSPASAQTVSAVPQLMNFQGRLTKPDGTPVADGNYSVTFSFFPVAVGGAAVWTQNVTNLQVRNGAFAALLGGGGSPFPAGTFSGNLWLQIKIGSDAPLAPRQQLVTVAYAMKTDSIKDGGVTSASLANGSVTSAKLAPALLNGEFWRLGGNAGTTPASSFLGTSDSQPLVFRTNNIERMRLTAGGRVGIGTSLPVDILTVAGSGTAISVVDGAVRTRLFAAAGSPAGYAGTSTEHPFVLRTNDSDRIVIGATGRVGIGTGTPTALLQVGPGADYGGVTTLGVTQRPADTAALSLRQDAASTPTRIQYVTNGRTANLEQDPGGGGLSLNGSNVAGLMLDVNGFTRFLGNINVGLPDILGWSNIAMYINSGANDYGVLVEGARAARYALYVNGKAAGSQGFLVESDARYKKNIATLPNALDAVLALRGVTYDWRRDEFKDKAFEAGQQIGFIAQEIEKVFPQLVFTDPDGFKSVNYTGAVPILVEAVKTLNAKVEKQDAEMKALSARAERKDAEIARLRARNADIETKMQALIERMERLETARK